MAGLNFLDKLSTLQYDNPGAAWKQMQAQQAETNYLNDPVGTIQNVGAIRGELPEAMGLRNDQQQQNANKVAIQQAQDAQRLEAQQRITAALQGVHRAGGDVGAAFDSFAPTLAGHGMTAEELAQLKNGIVANPTILDALDTKLQEARNKLVAVPGNGGQLYDPLANNGQGAVVARSDYHPMVVRDAVGNSTVFQPGGAGGPAAGGGLTNNGGAVRDGPFARSQPGYTGVDSKGFAQFSSPGAGIAAQERLLMSKGYLGGGNNTVNGIVDRYLGPAGPGNENSAESRANYKTFVAKQLGVDPGTPLPTQSVRALGAAMRQFENSSGGSGSPAPGGKVLFQTNASAAGVDGGLTPAAQKMIAERYKIDGTLPPLGMGKQAAALRTQILNKAAEGDTTGASIVANKADLHALQGSYSNQQKIYGQVTVAEQAALKNGQLFMQISRAAPGQTQFPIANKLIQQYGGNVGNAKVRAMNAASEVFAQEYGKAISGAAGGSSALTVSASEHARNLIRQQDTPQAKMQVMQTLTADMHNRIDSFRGNIAATRDAIAHIGQSPSAAAAPRTTVHAAGKLTGTGNKLVWSPAQ